MTKAAREGHLGRADRPPQPPALGRRRGPRLASARRAASSSCRRPRARSASRSEIAATVAEKAIDSLRAPIARVSGFDTPFPYTLEHVYKPDRAARAERDRVRRQVRLTPDPPRRRSRTTRGDAHGVRVQAARHRRGPHRGRGHEVARQGGPGRHGRPADGRGPDRQGDRRDHLARARARSRRSSCPTARRCPSAR